jgi:plastocyanin
VPAVTGPFTVLISSGSMKTYTLLATGSFPYYCDFDALSGMTGAVFVIP